MNATPRFAKTIFALISGVLVQAGSLSAQDYSSMRPALVGNGPKSLVNLINTKHVMDRGVQHGALFFYAIIAPNGFPVYSKVWGMTKETEPLRDELRERLAEARFVPAVYNHRNVYAGLFGTLAFSVVDGKPHLRIFANQELPELQKESDFIGPQRISIPGHIYDFTKVKEPFGGWMTEDKPGEADLSLTVDAAGHSKDVHVVSVTPAESRKYADAAATITREQTFLPAYRDGKRSTP
jgi:hypothetical protein